MQASIAWNIKPQSQLFAVKNLPKIHVPEIPRQSLKSLEWLGSSANGEVKFFALLIFYFRFILVTNLSIDKGKEYLPNLKKNKCYKLEQQQRIKSNVQSIPSKSKKIPSKSKSLKIPNFNDAVLMTLNFIK